MPIRFGTYNIRNGRNRGSESSLGGMSQANMDLGIFQETKVTDGIYTRGSDGYSVVATDAPIRHRGGLAEPEGDRRGEDIAAALATEGLEYMLAHFLPRRRPWCWAGRTWSILREGREVRSWTDYILETDRRLFGNVSVQDPRHNSDHYLVLSYLHSASLKEHTCYLGGRKNSPSAHQQRQRGRIRY